MTLVSELVFLLLAGVLAARALLVAAGGRSRRVARLLAFIALPLVPGCAALTIVQLAARLVA